MTRSREPYALDPYPLGCPLGIAYTPEHIQPIVASLCVKLRDLLRPTVHVVNPSKGKRYPLLNLHLDAGSPRIVVFPGWEDNVESPKSRVTYARQVKLLARIHDAGVPGETIDAYVGERVTASRFDPDTSPLLLNLAASASEMVPRIHDLAAYLGDVVRMTVSVLEQRSGPPIHVVRVYAPTDEPRPRVVMFPGWSGPGELASVRVGHEEQASFLATMAKHRVTEVPIEVFCGF